MNFKLLPVIALMLVLGTAMAHADATIDTLDQHLTFNGFGTLGVVHSDYSQADFIGNVVQPRGAGDSSYEHSDTQNVGYTLPWVRIPIEIAYTDAGLYSDGIDVLYRVKTGSVTQNLQAQWGRTSVDLPGVEFTSIPAVVVVLSDTLQYGDTSLRLVYQKYNGSGLPPVQLRVTGAGLTYDPGAWFIMGDSNYSQDKFFGDFFAWYVSGGVRLGRFAPYAIYSTKPMYSA
jgi:hypothetical protein